jgi:hypothetical protein
MHPPNPRVKTKHTYNRIEYQSIHGTRNEEIRDKTPPPVGFLYLLWVSQNSYVVTFIVLKRFFDVLNGI